MVSGFENKKSSRRVYKLYKKVECEWKARCAPAGVVVQVDPSVDPWLLKGAPVSNS